MSEWLKQINCPNDIKNIPEEKLPQLAKEIRKHILSTVSRNGGHLASNLGTVELTIALHRYLDFPEDKLVWDVGHQSYTHKILTGRRENFGTLRTKGGISGFPKMSESACDAFDTGHSSTSISVAAGMAKARDLKGENNRIVAVIGDGSMTGGMAYEALNNIGRSRTNMIIVLNDNEMSISENVGSMAHYLGKVRVSSGYLDFKNSVEHVLNRSNLGERLAKALKKTKDSIRQILIPGDFFTEMGLTYFGPVDGHDISAMVQTLQAAGQVEGAVLLHVVTKKGKGYRYAEQEPSKFHGISPFRIGTGEVIGGKKEQSYTDVFGQEMVALGQEVPEVVAITAAMTGGTGLGAFAKKYPERFFDVGIAEGHAVTFAAGMAVSGLHPVFAVYSTFLQRAYDQLIHDVCLNRLPVVFAVDRAGIVGSDGETHQGVFDVAFLTQMPGMTVMAPRNGEELRQMLRFAVKYDGPVAIRYPRGSADCENCQTEVAPVECGKSQVLCEEEDVAIVFAGPYESKLWEVRQKLKDAGMGCTLVDARFLAPFDTEMLHKLSKTHSLLVTVEEGIEAGGFGQQVMAYCNSQKLAMSVLPLALPKEFLPHGTCRELCEENGLTADGIFEKIQHYYRGSTT